MRTDIKVTGFEGGKDGGEGKTGMKEMATVLRNILCSQEYFQVQIFI